MFGFGRLDLVGAGGLLTGPFFFVTYLALCWVLKKKFPWVYVELLEYPGFDTPALLASHTNLDDGADNYKEKLGRDFYSRVSLAKLMSAGMSIMRARTLNSSRTLTLGLDF